MKVLTFHETSDSTSNELDWFISFKFNESKKEYYYTNDPTSLENIKRTLKDLVERLVEEESIDQILINVHRIVGDYYDNDHFNYTICREDCKDVDERGCKVYFVDNYYDDLIEFIIDDLKRNANVEEII